jgi:predicted unusual protein kinase regulating ubiquinone biosynthesis (AarF/ABC1/UbiB family)
MGLEMKAPESSRWKRAARMTKLSAGVLGSNVGYLLGNLFTPTKRRGERRTAMQTRTAQRIRRELQELRGPAMKLGQVLSMQSHLIDEKAIEELANLQMQAPPMHPTLMRIQFRNEMGCDPEEAFQEFEPEPFAAASLGQVHRARTKDGHRVAVKIQYPAVREIIEADFQTLSQVLLPARIMRVIPQSVIDELRCGILIECNYRNEARNIEQFGKGMKRLSFVEIPKLFPELCTDRVLTMSFMEGKHIGDFLRTKPSQEVRNRLGRQFLELFCFQAYGLQLIHADPHPGNYLLSTNHIGMVDFGCVKKLNDEVVQCIRDFALVRWRENEEVYRSMLKAICGPGGSPKDAGPRRTLDEMIRVYRNLYRDDGESTDFGDVRILRGMSRLYKLFLSSKFMPPQFLFYSRAEMGLYMTLHRLGARIPAYRIATEAMTSFDAVTPRSAHAN